MEKLIKKKRTLEVNDEQGEANSKKAKVFSAREFRKNLKPENLITSLKEFLHLAQQQEDGQVVYEYLEAGGSVEEILLLLDRTAKADLTSALPVFRVLHLIFISIKDSESRFYNQAKDGAKFLLDSFIPTIEAMMNINSNKHRKTVLKVLTSVVTLFPCHARVIMSLIPSSPKAVSQFFRPQSGTDTVRKWSIFFFLSFLIGGDFTLIRTVLSMKGILGDIISNLKFDEAETVNVFLSVIREKVLENVKMTKTLKLKAFNTQVITALFELYNWKGPKNINVDSSSSKKRVKEKEVNPDDKTLVTETVHTFLIVLCTSKKFGVVFTDKLGTYGESKNNLLSTVIQAVPEPWEIKRMSEIIIKMVVSSPELLGVVLSKIDPVIQPRSSKKWNNLIQFVENLLEAISPKDILKSAVEVSEIDLVYLGKKFCTPGVLIRNMNSGIQNKTSFPIIYYSMRILTLMWKKTEGVLASFPNNQKLKKTLTSTFSNSFLEFDDILELWKNVCTSSSLFDTVDKDKFLNVILNFLEMNSKCSRDNTDSPTRIASKMLDSLDPIKESLGGENYVNIQNRIFYLITSMDPMSVTPDNGLFKKAVVLLLKNNSKSTIETVSKIMLSTGVFENNESEIDIWLACYFDRFQEFCHFIPGVLADCISNLYLREIEFGENFIKNSSKKKSIFTELMEIDSSALLKKKWVNALTESEPTPLLIQLLEQLKKLSSSGSKKEMKEIRNYATYVCFRLFHYYNNNMGFMRFCLDYKNELNDMVFEYMEKKNNRRGFLAENATFLTAEEKALMAWIIKRRKKFSLETELKPEDKSSMRLYLTFNTIVSYLLTLVQEDSLSEEDVTKLSEFLTFFMKLGSGINISRHTHSRILSYDVDSLALLRAKCIECLFSIPLVGKFDVCEYENKTVINFTRLLVTVIMDVEKDDLKNFSVLIPWKQKLLSSIRNNLRDNKKTLEIFGNIEPLLDRFHYDSSEISDILNKYCNIKDMESFVSEGQLTMSTMVLIKFIKLQCDYSEIDQKAVNQLWNVMRHIFENGQRDFEFFDKCFIHVLRNRPKSLSLINNDFFECLLKRLDFNEETVSLGILLLCDPSKVKYFITFVRDNFKELKNKKIVAALSSTMVGQEDKFLDLLRFHKFYCYWKENEVNVEKDDSGLSELMKMIYKKYKGHIFNCDSKYKDIILDYSGFFSLLAKNFLEKESILEMKYDISKGAFLPETMHGVIIKYHDSEELMQTYVEGLLNIFYTRAKEVEHGECDELLWSKYSKYLCDVFSLEGNFKWDNVTKKVLWKDFIRLSLRTCFDFPRCPSYLKTIRNFVEIVYNPGENHRDAKIIFEMLISHSQFLSTMLQGSLLKKELALFYYSLITRNVEVLSVKHVPIILASYGASLSETDRTLLNILRFYEQNEVNMSEYEPLVWGEPAISDYSVKSNIGVSLWRRVNMSNVLELFDPKRMELSLKEFPIGRTIKEYKVVVVHNDKVYDPAFLLPVFTKLLAPGAVTYCLPFVQKGCFAYTICALSSVSEDIRISACAVLARFYNHLELVQNMKLKFVWLHFINCLRYAIENIRTEPLPSVITFFLARTSLELSGEPGDMFMSLQKYLLAKPIFNLKYIPEFLPLFHSSDVHYVKQRRWILEVLRDGFKQSMDLDLLFQTMALKLLLSYFSSQFCNREMKILVLEVLMKVMKTDKAKLLISEYGFLTWLNAICLNCDRELLNPFIKLVSLTTAVVKTKPMRNVPGKRNLFYLLQIANVLVKAVPNLRECRSVDTLETFLSALLDCLTIMLKFKHKNWCKANKTNLEEISRISVKMIGDETLHEKLSKCKFYFTFSGASNNLERLHRKIIFVSDALQDFL